MDIRNIKENPETVTSFQLLPKIFEYNMEQLELYKDIEDLPEWPFNVNSPKDQGLLKFFIGNIVEELIEGVESLRALRSSLVGWNLSVLDSRQSRTASNHLQNANEEQADALGFFLSIFTFSNIGPEDILDYKDVATWEEVFTNGVAMMVKDTDWSTVGIDTSNCYNLEELATSVTPGFLHLSDLTISNFESRIFEVIYHLNLARNLLKSRIWKQTQVITKEGEYQEELVKAFYLYMGALAFEGFTPQNYYELFYKKHQLNLWRIKTNY